MSELLMSQLAATNMVYMRFSFDYFLDSMDPVSYTHLAAQALMPTGGLILSSCLALIISNQLYKYNDISRVVIFTLLLPVFGVILSALMLHEAVNSPTPVSYTHLWTDSGPMRESL